MLTTTRYRVWKLIADQPRTQSDLASLLALPASTIADVIRRLRQSGHIVTLKRVGHAAVYKATGVDLCPNGTGNVGNRPRPGYRSKSETAAGTIALDRAWKPKQERPQ